MYDTIKIKGMQSIKSDYNADICDKVNDIFNRKVMARLTEMDFKGTILEAKELTKSIDTMIKTDDYILHKSTIKKSNKSSEELAFGDAKNKMARLWKRFGMDGEVEYPGSYKELNVKFNNHILGVIEVEEPEVFNGLVEHVREIKLYEFYRNCINGSRKFLDGRSKLDLDSLAVIDKDYVESIKKFTHGVQKLNAEQLDERFAKKMSFDLFKDNFDKKYIDTVRKCLVMGPRDIVVWNTEKNDVDIPITYQDIIDNIDRIALPLDINTVPNFLKLNNYDIIDSDFAATGEFLLGGLTDTMGISCPRNKSDKMMISSALQTY